MARAPNMILKREDYEEVQGVWMDRLIRALNIFAKQTNAALSNGVTFGENVACFLKTIDVPGSVSASQPITIANSLPSGQKPVGVLVLSAQDGSGNPVSLGSPSWKVASTGGVALQGFQNQSGKVTVTLLVLGG